MNKINSAITSGVAYLLILTAALPGLAAGFPAMEKYVSPQANFSLYKPAGWTVAENGNDSSFSIMVTDPSGKVSASQFYGKDQFKGVILSAAGFICQPLQKQCPDLKLDSAFISPDKKHMSFMMYYTDPAKGRREAQCWITLQNNTFLSSMCQASPGQLKAQKPLLLSIISNIHLFKGGFSDTAGSAAPKTISLKQCRLNDGSASFSIPQDWTFISMGNGQLFAKDASGLASFIVANVDIITPRLGVSVPNTPVLPYMAPDQAIAALFSWRAGINDMRFIDVKPRNDIAQQMMQVYTAGPVQSAELIYTFTSQGRACKGFTFGNSMGSNLGMNWKYFHMTVTAPAEQFDGYAPSYATMMESYHIDDQFAQRYIANGIQRLRQLQKQTNQVMARTREEISSMMQAAYDERQRSQDYIDYQRTNYIRGEQDWISSVEGGAVYHTDTWGTQNTYTGESWEGAPFDYLHFTGENPKYNEQMTAIDNRQLYDKVFAAN
jgi:hypothetical protein